MTELTSQHAPSHLREQFQEWLDSYEPNRLSEIDIQPVAAVLDALADCGDVLPADYCDQLDIPKGSTYAQAVEEVRRWYAKTQGQPATEPALESLDEAKARWDSMLGMVSTPDEQGVLVLRSPTGFPLATMELSEGRDGRYAPSFGQPVAAQTEWIDDQAAKRLPERSAEDVYWEYVEKVGEERCADAVLNYLDRSMVVEILLERIYAPDLDEYLHDNFIADWVVPGCSPSPKSGQPS